MSEYTDILREVTAQGTRPKTEVVADLAQEAQITENAAEAIVNHECRFEENGQTYVTGLDDRVTALHDLNVEVGEPTGESFYDLPVLEDVGHPLVKELGHSYIPREVTGNRSDREVVCRALANPDYSTLLIGETGVGKNVLLRHISEQTNRPMVRVNFGLDTTYEKLVGLYTPVDDGSGNVTFEWRDGLLTSAVRNGWMFVADEINAAPPEATVPLNGINESFGARELAIEVRNEVLTDQNGGIHPEFVPAGTMNPPRYAGTEPMNMAFKGRFFPIIIPHLDEEGEVALLMEKTALSQLSNGEAIVTDLVKLANHLRSQMVGVEGSGSVTVPVSSRQLEQIAHLIVQEGETEMFMEPHDAVELVLKGFADNQTDWETIRAVMERVFSSP